MTLTALPPLQQLSREIQEGNISPSEVVECCLSRIRLRDGDLQAWAYVAEDEARREAERLTKQLREGGPRGKLQGIPFGVKDIFDTVGIPTEWGTPLCSGRVPSADARLVRQLRQAGAVVLGKTHTTAFAYFDAGPTRNPHNLQHTPGGSSSGSAAAVADRMIPFALGSQTLGSVIRPASFCGTVGLKPTFGRLPLEGVMPFAHSLDHAGLFTRTVDDMSWLWSAIGGEAAIDAAAKRLATVSWPPDGGLGGEMEESFGQCLERLASAGFVIESIELPATFEDLPEATRTIMKYEGAQVLRGFYEKYGAKIGVKLAAVVAEGLALEEAVYREAITRIREARAAFATVTNGHPVWITPAAPGPAPEGLQFTGDPRCNLPFTALGVPALTLPFGLSASGLPLGLQLAAAERREGHLLATAIECERALGQLS